MPKIAVIGAGSAAFSRRLMGDVLHWPDLCDSEIALVDLDKGRLDLIEALVEKMVAQKGTGAKVTATTNRESALDGADYVITTLAVGYAYEQDRPDVAIPRQFNLYQTVADTTGVGGIFRYLRTAPAMLGIVRDMQRLCPNAMLLNYVNPMSMLMWTLSLAAPDIRNVGLCHSVQGTSNLLARFAGVPSDEVSYSVAGINHQAWFLQLRHHTYRGEDLYPRIWEALEKPDLYEKERVRFEIFRNVGYFVTESSRHNSEYVPWFRKTVDERARYTPLDSLPDHMRAAAVNGYDKEGNPEGAFRGNGASSAGGASSANGATQGSGASGGNGAAPLPAAPPVRHAELWDLIKKQVAGEVPLEFTLGHEYASYIMHAVETNVPFRFNGNVQNTGLITNLPPDCNVEVPIFVDSAGMHPCYVGDLPSQCAAINRTNVNVHELTVKGFLERDRNAIYQAAMLDPLAAATVKLADFKPMIDQLFEANARWLDGWEAKGSQARPGLSAPTPVVAAAALQ
jgi:alpha-galactosidase